MMEGLGEGELSIVLYNKVLEVVKENEYPLLNVRITQATVLPRILPGSQEEIDHARSRVEAEIDKILENGTLFSINTIVYPKALFSIKTNQTNV
jgi:hypothetical protein